MIWWCSEHAAAAAAVDEVCMYEGEWGESDATNCQISEALLIVKENGEWPEKLKIAWRDWAEQTDLELGYFLDALASVGGDSQ